MKRLICCFMVIVVAFSAFAAINFTIDTIAQFADEADPSAEVHEGFTIGGADETVFTDMNATLTSGPATALVNLRFRMPSAKYDGAAVEVHAWEIRAKLTDWLRLSVGNTAYEIFTESISWEPVFGAGLFEQGKNRIYLDITPTTELQIIAGMSMGQDYNKPWKTAQVAAIYEIPMVMNLAAEFSLVSNSMCLEMYNDGEVKTFSFQADYLGTENLEVVGGYTMIMAENSIVQHRFDLFGNYTGEKCAVQLYDAMLLRLYAGETMGNRLGFKFDFQATEKLTPSIKVNWFKNYGYAATYGGFAWADCQLVGPGSDKNLFVAEPSIGFTISDNVYGSIGATFKYNFDPSAANKIFWSIPLCMTATF